VVSAFVTLASRRRVLPAWILEKTPARRQRYVMPGTLPHERISGRTPRLFAAAAP
jgi:hypothetical protein